MGKRKAVLRVAGGSPRGSGGGRGRDVIAITSVRDGTSELKPSQTKTRRLPASGSNGGDGNRRPTLRGGAARY